MVRALIRILVAFIPLAGAALRAQEAPVEDRGPALSVDAGIGMVFRQYVQGGISSDAAGGGAFLGRVTWHLSGFLGVAASSGYVVIAHRTLRGAAGAIGGGDGTLSIVSVPVGLELHLHFDHFWINPGFIVNFTTTRIDAFGEQSSASKVDYGYLLNGGIRIPLARSLDLLLQGDIEYLTDLKLVMFIPRAGLEIPLL